MDPRPDENAQIAARLREAGDLLHAQGANPFRAGAYHRAAETVEAFGGSLREEFDKHGVAGLQRLPGIGVGIANAIAEMLITGRWSQLGRLRGDAEEGAPPAHQAAAERAPDRASRGRSPPGENGSRGSIAPSRRGTCAGWR